jgi:hypothetical protein
MSCCLLGVKARALEYVGKRRSLLDIILPHGAFYPAVQGFDSTTGFTQRHMEAWFCIVDVHQLSPLALRLHRWLSGKASLAPPCLNTRDSHIQCLRRCYLSGQRCTWQGWNHALQFTSQHRSKSSLPRSQLIHYLILFYPCHLSIIAGAARLLTVAFRSLGHSMRQRA